MLVDILTLTLHLQIGLVGTKDSPTRMLPMFLKIIVNAYKHNKHQVNS